jgi:transcriptional regulator with AAA-type ATPase domain
MKLSKKEIAKALAKDRKKHDGHSANNLEQAGWVKDRKTGEYYDPKAAFDRLMNTEETMSMLKRLGRR